MKKYPYSQMDSIVCVSTILDEKKKQQASKQHKNPLKDKFPWIQPRNKQDLSNFIIRESKTQQSQPFYIRLELVHSQFKNLLSTKNSIDNFLKNLTEKKKMKNETKQEVIEDKKIIPPPIDVLKTCSAYIFTGIAKSSITSHEIFDTLFHTTSYNYHQKQNDNEEDENNSQMRQKCKQQGHLQVSNQIKLSWDFKYKSKEYFQFMNRSYQEFKKKYEKQLLPQELQRAVAYEMFPYGKARIFKYFQGTDARQLDQKQYFNYFFQLFSKHTQQINKLTNSNQQNPNNLTSKSQTLQIFNKSHHLEQFDFEAYLSNQFKDTNISYQAFESMIIHNKKRYNHIINNFPFKTRKQRVKILNQLVNQNKTFANKMSLVQLCGQFKESNNESDQYLILQQCYGFNDPPKIYILKEIIDMVIQQTQQAWKYYQNTKHFDKFNFKQQSVFTDIVQYFFYEQEYKPFRFITYDPQYVHFHSPQIITPLFSRAIQKMLGFDKLPKTQQQQLLISTPNFQINMYEKVQYLLHVHRQAQANSKLGILCNNLTSINSKFLLSDGMEDKNQRLQSNILRLLCQSKQNFIVGKSFIYSLQNIRLRLLQLSMIKYEIRVGKRIYMYDNKSNQPYNSSKLDHHKKIETILFILMIRIGIINKISFIAQQDDASLQLRKEYQKMENSFIEFLKKLIPFKLKDQKNNKLNAQNLYTLPLSRYFEPIVYYHSIFQFRNKLYCNILSSNSMNQIEVLIISQVHKIIIIKELFRMDKYKQSLEDRRIKELFSNVSDSLSNMAESKIKFKMNNNSQKNQDKDKQPKTISSIKSKTKIFWSQFKKIQQFCINYKQKLQKKQRQNINQSQQAEKTYQMKKLREFTFNLQKLDIKFQKIYWQLFSNLYESIAKYENEDQNYLSLYYNILLYFCSSSQKTSIRNHFINTFTIKESSQQLKKKILYLKNVISEMILSQNI